MRKIVEDYGLALLQMVLGIGFVGLFGVALDIVTRS